MNKIKKILVTGGGGYIGVPLVSALVKQGFSVRIFDNFYFGLEPLESIRNKVEIVKGDIRNIPSSVFSGVEVVIHLAGLSNDPTAEFNPKANFAINTRATISLAKKAKRKRVQLFIFASTASIYNTSLKSKIKKNEKYSVFPKTAYALSKFRAENGILKIADSNFTVVILRKGTVFGFSPRMRYDLVVNMMIMNALQHGKIKLFNQGKQWRPLVSVDDVVRAYIQILKADRKKINKQIFNISFDNFMVKDIALRIKTTMEKHLKKKISILYDEGDKNDRSYLITNKKAQKLLHFLPEVSVEDSIDNIIKNIQTYKFTDFDNPIYYNILHMKKILKNE